MSDDDAFDTSFFRGFGEWEDFAPPKVSRRQNHIVFGDQFQTLPGIFANCVRFIPSASFSTVSGGA